MAAVLIVDSTLTLATDLARELTRAITASGASHVEVIAEAEFAKARVRLKTAAPRLMVTALQLREYNGVHLVYLAAAAGLSMRSVVHTDVEDPVHAQEVRAAGAFYEIRSRLPIVLPAYVSATLPAHDRRANIKFDRRRLPRGGRRAADYRPSV